MAPPPHWAAGSGSGSAAAGSGSAGLPETELQRWQRNFNELLQELRVAQTGVQILFAFLLILAFTPEFDAGEGFTRVVYLVALLSAAGATAFLIAPVAYHRLLFRRSEKPQLVIYAHRLAFAGLMLVMVSMVSAVLLACDVVLERWLAVVVSGLVGVGFALLWAVLPLRRRRK